MEMEMKHFSHVHVLTSYHMPEGSESLCSGCNLGGLSTVYMCWQCQFFLHEQCFKAKRSLPHHPSHPAHPLSFFPSPTHPSASFLCNSCHLSGTGFCYACADCNFDLHVHCAYNTLSTTADHHPYHQNPSILNNFNPHRNYSFPGIEFQNPNYSNNHFTYPPISDPYPPPPVQPYASEISPPVLDSYPNVSHQPPLRPYASENNPIVDSYSTVSHPPPVRPYASENYPPVADSYPPVSHPLPVRPYASENNPPIVDSYPTVSHPPPVRPYASENNPPIVDSYPTVSHQPPVRPYASENNPPIVDSYPPVSHPPPVRPYAPENNPPIPASPASSPIPAYYNQPKPASSSSTDQNQAQQTQVAKHFSHQHALRQSNIHEEEGLLCSGCEQALSGQAYTCTKSKLCEFRLHKSCFDLPKEIQHKSHKPHPLYLLATPPSKSFYVPEFTCNACFKTGNSFLYHCSACDYSLHVTCALLSESVKRADHEHPLSLLHSSPYKKSKDGEDDVVFMCNVCECSVDPKCWVYYCKECDFGTEVGCVNGEAEKGEEKAGEREGRGKNGDELTMAERMMELQSSFQRNQIQLQMSHQNAMFMNSIGQSFSNLAG